MFHIVAFPKMVYVTVGEASGLKGNSYNFCLIFIVVLAIIAIGNTNIVLTKRSLTHIQCRNQKSYLTWDHPSKSTVFSNSNFKFHFKKFTELYHRCITSVRKYKFMQGYRVVYALSGKRVIEDKEWERIDVQTIIFIIIIIIINFRFLKTTFALGVHCH